MISLTPTYIRFCNDLNAIRYSVLNPDFAFDELSGRRFTLPATSVPNNPPYIFFWNIHSLELDPLRLARRYLA